MRIGVIVPGFSAHEDDWAIPAVRDLVRELGSRHEVRVCALRYPERSAYTVDGALVTAVGGGDAAGVGRGSMLLRAARDLATAHRRRGFDLLHGLWADEPGALAVGLARRWRIPAVVSVMGGEFEARDDLGYGGALSWANRRLSRRALAGADAVTAGSRWLADGVSADHGRDVEALPLGVDTTRFAPEGSVIALTGEVPLLHVASLTPVKGQRILLDAFERVRAEVPGVHLHVVGDGPLRDEIAGRPGVSVHGHVAHEVLPGWYRGAVLHVQASWYESQGMTVLEAAACGRLTVGTRVGVLPELAPDHVVPPGDAAALAARMSALLADRDRLVAEAGTLTGRVRSHYALDVRTRDLERLYRRVSSRTSAISS